MVGIWGWDVYPLVRFLVFLIVWIFYTTPLIERWISFSRRSVHPPPVKLGLHRSNRPISKQTNKQINSAGTSSRIHALFITQQRLPGAMVARLTPDQKVICSNQVVVKVIASQMRIPLVVVSTMSFLVPHPFLSCPPLSLHSTIKGPTNRNNNLPSF